MSVSVKRIYEYDELWSKDFNLFLKQFYDIVLNTEKIQKVKTQKLQRQKRNTNGFIKCAVCYSRKLRFIKN